MQARYRRETRRVDPRRFYDREKGLYIVTEGVASTGQVSPLGTVTHTEYRSDSGRCDAGAQVRTIKGRLTPEGEIVYG